MHVETQTAAVKATASFDQPLLDPFFTLSLDLLCVVGFDGYFKRWNPVCEKTLGFTAAELLATPAMQFVHPSDRALTKAYIQQLLLSAEPICFENRCLCQDGSYRWLSWKAQALPEQKLIYATAHDITERRRSAKQLRSSEERFQLLVESVKDYAIYMLDSDGVVISWNTGAERIKGYSAEEVIGRHFSCFYPPEQVQEGKPAWELQQAATLGQCEVEGERVRRDGSRFWVNALMIALRDNHGQLQGFAKVTRDITERKQTESILQQAFDQLEKRVHERTSELSQANFMLKQEIAEREQMEAALRQSEAQLKQQAQQLESTLHELQRTQSQLVQSEKMSSLGQLVAGVAHEINNPVSFIYGNVKYADEYVQTVLHLLTLYQQQCPDPVDELQAALEGIDLEFLATDLQKLLQSMKVGAERIREIVLSLRNFSRLDEAEMKAVDIHEGLDNTLLILKNRLKAHAGHPGITVLPEYGDLPLVECYAGQLNQVFMNILSNAIDVLEDSQDQSAEQPGVIHVCTTVQADQWVVIRIADNGPGISETVQRRLFDPFFTTKPVGRGVGLGLSISYQIVVEKHGGRLKCHSIAGQGTEFVIEIPSSAALRSSPPLAEPVHILPRSRDKQPALNPLPSKQCV
ncbi:PAS domain S-box protein [Trichocoleus desertorum AS-A10]|uniref:PAS domain-containing sensor histidine kinase n=1 Tax=Trichocoleus desertorum TaxID=1481672 RepID=UPI0032992DBD